MKKQHINTELLLKEWNNLIDTNTPVNPDKLPTDNKYQEIIKKILTLLTNTVYEYKTTMINDEVGVVMPVFLDTDKTTETEKIQVVNKVSDELTVIPYDNIFFHLIDLTGQFDVTDPVQFKKRVNYYYGRQIYDDV